MKKTVYGDGIYYYAWLRSVAVDHDINFRNDYGHAGNIYSVGPAILWSPGFLWIHSLIRGDGTSFPYQITVGLMSVGYAIVGLLLLLRLVKNRLVVFAIAFATNLFFYGSLDTVNSHALSFFAATLFLSFVFQKRKSWFLIGFSLGLMSSIRSQDFLYVLLLFPGMRILHFVLGFFAAFLPQLAAWQLLYGRFWISPYLDRGYGFDFLHPKILEVLFSPNNGLFLWTPITLLGIIGLVLAKRFILLFLFAAQLYLIASWTTWWQGASYSGRMFISVLPVVAVGLTHLFTRLKRLHWSFREFLLIIIAPLSGINIMLVIYYLITH